MFSSELISAIQAVACDCASEVESDGETPMREILAETAIDASRLEMWGYDAQQKELNSLIDKHGYDNVFLEACKHVPGV